MNATGSTALAMENAALRAENERLRAALVKIERELSGDMTKAVIAVSLPRMRSIARAALEK